MSANLIASDAKALIEGERKNFEAILERIARNGPSDTEATAALMASSIRFSQLESIKRNYLTDWNN